MGGRTRVRVDRRARGRAYGCAGRKLDVCEDGDTFARMIVCVGGQKGGCGKTTTAISIASEWHARGRRVLLVDADPQGTTRTWGEVATEAKRNAPTVIAMGAGMHRPDQLPALAAGYEMVVIDTPPRHGDIQRSALAVSDLVVLPVGPGAAEAWALGSMLDVIEEVRVLRPELQAVLLITRRQANTALGKAAREAPAASGLPILRAELGYRVTYQEFIAGGEGVTIYAPGSLAAMEIKNLVDELETFAKEPSRAVA